MWVEEWDDVVQVCGSMPYDDSDVKKMIKYQTERKVGFSRSKRINDEVKDLIHCILEAQVERRYTVDQITHHPWMQSGMFPPQRSSSPGAAAAAGRTQTPGVANGGAPRVTVVAGETAAAAGRVGATPAAATTAVADTMSQNNNSNVDDVWSTLFSNIIHSVHSLFSSTSTTATTTKTDKKEVHNSELQLAARYAYESAVDRERLRKTAKAIWPKRRSSIHLALRPPWR